MVSNKSLRVLIIGSGGREHALLRACKASPLVAAVSVAPGNGGMEQEAVCYPLNVSDSAAIVALAKKLDANFVIIGPEVPLSVGVVDALEAAGIPAYGPVKAGAKLEASKNFTKEFLVRHNIPTATGKRFTSSEEAVEYLSSQKFPIVIKADGLASGKGVIIAEDFDQACTAVYDMLDSGCFGKSGSEILIEEFMEGEEASIMLMVCEDRYVMLPASQDHKRVGEGDTGLNTGGMGAYAPAPVVTPEIERRVVSEIVEPTLKGLVEDGIRYRGTLYVGIMITTEGPKVVEFNVRFGDPECQVLLPLLKTDPVEVMYACATGTLDPTVVEFHKGSNIIVVLAAEGYPGTPRKGDVISLPTRIPAGTGIIHSGTVREDNGTITTAGGRVLGVTARGENLSEAAARAYELVSQIHFEGMHYRRDIGARQLKRDSAK
ncbi:MAG: phosphoribosylamine--glycine ligase [Verrucomicrobia bacterium]|nr:phosphoribosylamine--glycine ligase [Verrucomicrobiota bacterium]